MNWTINVGNGSKTGQAAPTSLIAETSKYWVIKGRKEFKTRTMKKKEPQHMVEPSRRPAASNLETALGAPSLSRRSAPPGFCCGHTVFQRRDLPRAAPRRRRGRKEGCPARGGGEEKHGLGALTEMHCLMMQLCFIRRAPNFFMSLQVALAALRPQVGSHLRHRRQAPRAPAVVRLAANFYRGGGPSFPWRPDHRRTRGRRHGRDVVRPAV